MQSIRPFDFGSYRDYLQVAGRTHPTRKHRRITLDQWAKRLGYRSPRSVAMVLKGQRLPSAEMVDRLSRDLRLSEVEHRYFELMVQLERDKRQGRDVTSTLDLLEKLNPHKKTGIHFYDSKTYIYVAEWYHFVIKQLIETPGFQENFGWIRARLRHKVTTLQIRRAIETMLQLGIIKRNDEGRLQAVHQSTYLPGDTANSAGRRHLRQMSIRAIEALEEQEVLHREFDSTTFRMDPKDMEKAKEYLREMRRAFLRRFHTESGSSVYQINFQLFEHTTNGRSNGSETNPGGLH